MRNLNRFSEAANFFDKMPEDQMSFLAKVAAKLSNFDQTFCNGTKLKLVTEKKIFFFAFKSMVIEVCSGGTVTRTILGLRVQIQPQPAMGKDGASILSMMTFRLMTLSIMSLS